jgi:hemolysin activation/secretion protein
VPVQHKVVGGWELGLNHKEFIGQAILEGTLAFKHGTGGFGARVSPQEIAHPNPSEPLEGTSRMRLYTAELSLNSPFKVAEEKLRYSGLVRAQWNRTPLMPQDRVAIGGRYTVRGFEGETSLMGERGWLIAMTSAGPWNRAGRNCMSGPTTGMSVGVRSADLLGRNLAVRSSGSGASSVTTCSSAPRYRGHKANASPK